MRDILMKKRQQPTSVIAARTASIVTIVTTPGRLTPKPSVTPTPTERESIVTSADVLATVRLGLFTLLTNFVDVGKKFHELLCAVSHCGANVSVQYIYAGGETLPLMP
jgi:hypothetical protein